MFNGLIKNLAVLSALILAGTATVSHAGGLNVNVDIGVPAPAPPPVVYAPAPPPPAYAPPPPAYAPPPQVVLPATPPQFVYVPELGYYVAIGTPYDIAYIGNQYYIYNNGYWYRTSYYGGPMVLVERRMWPSLLLRFNLRDFRRYREREFRTYSRDKAHYRGQMHRPEVRKEERHDMRREERHEGERR